MVLWQSRHLQFLPQGTLAERHQQYNFMQRDCLQLQNLSYALFSLFIILNNSKSNLTLYFAISQYPYILLQYLNRFKIRNGKKLNLWTALPIQFLLLLFWQKNYDIPYSLKIYYFPLRIVLWFIFRPRINFQFAKLFLNISLLFIEIEKMPELLQIPNLTSRFIQYDPHTYSYSIADTCKTCKNKIIHHECITVCNCYRYCHQKCFLSQINKSNKDKEELNYSCKTCGKALQINYKMEILKKPHINLINISYILISIICLPICFYLAFKLQNDYVKLTLDSLCITFFTSLLVLGLINSVMVRQFTAHSVTSTQLGLIISAFMDLQGKIQEQATNTELIR